MAKLVFTWKSIYKTVILAGLIMWFLVGTKVRAASGMPEFGETLASMVETFGMQIKAFVDIIEMVLAY